MRNRFLQKVKRTDTCWEWTGSKKVSGYGELRAGEGSDKKLSAHRVSYELFIGKIPEGAFVLHSCDNPGCVNPTHLRAGTPKENMIDKSKRGRSNQSKLVEEDILQIRELCDQKILQKDIAKKFGVHKSTVSHIKNKRTNAYV